MSALAAPLKGANGIGDEAGDAQKALEAESPMRETAGTSAVHDHSAADDDTVARDDPPANEADEVEDEAGDEVAEERDPDQQSESGEAGWQAEGLAVQKDGNGDAEGAQSGDDAAEPGSSKSTTTPHTWFPAPEGKRNRALKQSVFKGG